MGLQYGIRVHYSSKNFLKRKAQDWITLLVNSTNWFKFKKDSHQVFKNISIKYKIENYQLTLWAYYYPDLKRKKERKETDKVITRKLQINISYGYRFKRIQQNTSKLNLTAYIREYTPQPGRSLQEYNVD